MEAAKGQFGGGKLDGVSVVKETFNPDDGSTDDEQGSRNDGNSDNDDSRRHDDSSPNDNGCAYDSGPRYDSSSDDHHEDARRDRR